MIQVDDGSAQRREWIATLVSTLVFLGLSIGFLVSLGVLRPLIGDVSFYDMHGSRYVTSQLQPAAVCGVAVVLYFFGHLLCLRQEFDKHGRELLKVVDGVFFPLLMCALAGLVDPLQIMFMFFNYVCVTILAHARDVRTTLPDESDQAVHFLCWLSFLIAYSWGVWYNWGVDRPGGGVAQILVLGVLGYDLARLAGREFKQKKHIESFLRLVVLVSAFADTI